MIGASVRVVRPVQWDELASEERPGWSVEFVREERKGGPYLARVDFWYHAPGREVVRLSDKWNAKDINGRPDPESGYTLAQFVGVGGLSVRVVGAGVRVFGGGAVDVECRGVEVPPAIRKAVGLRALELIESDRSA